MHDAVVWLPSPLLALVVLTIVVAYAAGGLALTQRWVPADRRRLHNDVAAPISGLVGVVFAVLIAFVAVAVWREFEAADELVLREANAAGDVWRQAYAYPEPMRSRVRDGIQNYLDDVLREEWPMQAAGRADDRAWRIIEGVHRQLLRYEPPTRGLELVHAEQLRSMNVLIDMRRNRLHVAGQGISTGLWAVMLTGCTLLIALTWFFGTENRTAHLAMTACLAIAIGMIVFLIAALDYPFTGDLAVRPHAFENVLTLIKRLAVDETSAVP